MDDYTPDTREVRIAYNHWGKYPEFAPDDFDVTEAEFNRWLAEVVRVARAEGWDACVDAHREVVVAGWKVDSGIMKDTNPYKEKE